jgi:hypothetical protein
LKRLRHGADWLWQALSEEEDARVCRDIPEAACDEQPHAFALQLVAQALGKLGDTLSSSRVVLPWLLTSIAAPAAFIAWLVPLRESLSLLPQLVVAAQLRAHPLRRGFYAAGAAAQGLCLLLMPATLLLPSPAASASLLLLLLALFSLARGVCSVASKDVLGKTVSRQRRGRLTGLASSASGLFGVCLAAALLLAGLREAAASATPVLVAMLLTAALCWFAAALLYLRVPEQPGATGGGGNALSQALRSVALLRTDAVLRRFVLARMLLVASAFTIPYLVVMARQQGDGGVGSLGAVLLAEGLAALTSGAVWGVWSDRAAQHVMAAAAALTALVLGSATALLQLQPALLGQSLVVAILLYLGAVAHQGARVGRKTYLVDIATSDNRASYVAVSNTVLGVFMLAGGGLGAVQAQLGLPAVLAALLLMSLAAVALSLRLPRAS